MRWDSLFDDLESQLESELSAEAGQMRAEEERLRLGRLSVRDRLTALAGAPEGSGLGQYGTGSTSAALLRLELRSGANVVVRPRTFGKDWFAGELVTAGNRRPQCVIPLSAIASVVLDRSGVRASLVEQSTPPARLADRIGLSFVLRDLCRRRAAIELDCGLRELNGASRVLHGTLDRVGRDHCDLALHEANEPRRESAVTAYRIVPFEQIMLLKMIE